MSKQQQNLPEITITVVLLAIFLAIILAASNTYLALKIGMLTSASIPAAIISMGILRFFKHSNILQNNLVQTAASAGEAVAGGIVYTIPALIIIHYWKDFNYFENFFIALIGGVLGVLFSVPLRRVLMNAKHLTFPEGKAIAGVLQIRASKAAGMKEMILGSGAGGLLELMQTGFKFITPSFQQWFSWGKMIVGFGGGFSAALIGAGYIIGFRVGFSIFIGALIGWFFGVPYLSFTSPGTDFQGDINQLVAQVYNEKIHDIGIGAMLVAGIWTLLTLLKPFYESLSLSLQAFTHRKNNLGFSAMPQTERDIPIHFVMIGIFFTLVGTYFLLKNLFQLDFLEPHYFLQSSFIIGSLFYILIIGFIFSAICGYFSGLVGVSASPGSSVIIASILLAALIVRTVMGLQSGHLSSTELINGAAITIMIGSIITGAAAIANDNIQDLKVGHIIGATPWKQQVMLLIGVIVAAAVIPPIMHMLFHVYGIGGVFPRPGMDPNQMLAAPPAAMMATISQGVFNHNLPWEMLGIGALVIFAAIIINKILEARGLMFSILGIAIGIYLPLASSIPLFLGSLIAFITQRALTQKKKAETEMHFRLQKSLLLACGLVSGAALMDVLLSIPMGISGNAQIWRLMPESWNNASVVFGALAVLVLGYWFYHLVNKSEK